MHNQLEIQLDSYHRWREDIRASIEGYQTWLDRSGHVDIQRTLRIYDLLESLRKDRLVVAFVAEFSRGKTELINALFFSGFRGRLLPSDVGRTTMCPTEIFFDAADEPYLRLLPIETRKREESVSSMKQHPIEWVKVKLDPQSPEQMAQAMAHLTQTKTVSAQEARALGLLDGQDPGTDRVVVPAWRHALVNYPHPWLRNGLVILDTPGLNALGAEPELTLKTIPGAHAVVFLLAVDTGVTRSDLEIWQQHVQPHQTCRIAVLNKIDLLWDDLNTAGQIDQAVTRQIAQTGEALELKTRHVVALSAQKALVGRVRGDERLVARSNIAQLESLLGNEVMPAKREIMRSAVVREMADMVNASLHQVIRQLAEVQTELEDVSALAGKNRGIAKSMLMRLEKGRASYLEQMERFQRSYGNVLEQGEALKQNLDRARLDEIFAASRKEIEGSWTTAGLHRSMNRLFDAFSTQADRVLAFASRTCSYVDEVYAEFRKRFDLPGLQAPVLNLERHVLAMRTLKQTTERFCRDPRNLMTEKRFLVRRFYTGLVDQARQVFEQVRVDFQVWSRDALVPISNQLSEHQALMQRRVENFRRLSADLSSVQERVHQLEAQKLTLSKHADELLRLKAQVAGVPPEALMEHASVPNQAA
ncbi:MAG: dynamin family protein [Burkholderiales bacterium]|nr:dynamin family protein [Burkholderiales bacterium]